jgi:hypothetical protein
MMLFLGQADDGGLSMPKHNLLMRLGLFLDEITDAHREGQCLVSEPGKLL